MYWWDYRALANDLKNNAVSKDSVIGYALLFILFYALGFLLDYSDRETAESTSTGVSTLIGWGFILLPIIVCYFVNRNGDNKGFIKRYVCISWPVGVRSCAVTVVLVTVYAILLTVLIKMYRCDSESCLPLADILFAPVIAALFAYTFKLYVTAFRIAAGKEVLT